MRQSLRLVLAATVLCTPFAAATAQDPRDSLAVTLPAPESTTGLGDNWFAQSFRPPVDTLSGVGAFISQFSPTLQVEYRVYAGVAAAGAPLVASGIVTHRLPDAAPFFDGYIDLFFAPVGVNPSLTYYLYGRAVDNAIAVGTYAVAGEGVYADGAGFFVGRTLAGPFSGLPSDAAFRLYTRGVAPPATTVPEPSTYVLMAAGLAGIVGVARRRRA